MENMELIKDRINHILRAKNLTATQFAEMMQIQPSNVSHLLSGRNKPSLDFLIKLKNLFPEYSFDWIILGKKPITINDPSLFNNDSNKSVNMIEPIIYDRADEVTNVDVSAHGDVVESILDKPEVNNSVVGLKQIIYVFDNHTFEIYNLKK